MLLQLGNIIFEKAFAPDGINRSDETTYAQHDLINQKPRLQPTANNLEVIEMGIKLRAEHCNITQTILQLKNSKDTFEVLPFLMGTGRYLGDYVITKMDEATTLAFADGLPIETLINITLQEFAVPNKLQQQQNAQRKQAFAVGEKKPVKAITLQPNTAPQITAKELNAAYSSNALAQTSISQFGNNVSAQPQLSTAIEKHLKNANSSLAKVAAEINSLPLPINKADIIAKIQQAQSAIGQFAYPITDLTVLNNNNLNLQQKIKALKTATGQLLTFVVVRAA